MKGSPPRIAIISNSQTPYRMHVHQRIVRDLPEAELWSAFTHDASNSPWKIEPPPGIRPLYWGKGERSEHQDHVFKQAREWKKGGAILRWIREHGVRFVVLEGYNDAGRLRILWGCRRAGIPCFIFGDNNILCDRPAIWKSPWKRPFVSSVLRRATGVLYCGKLGREYFRRYGAAEAGMFPFPYEPDYAMIANVPQSAIAAARERFGLRPGRRYFVYSGRFTGVKRVDLLLRAYRHVAHERPDWDLLMIGDGPLREPLLERFPANMRPRIICAGFLSEPETIAALYHLGEVSGTAERFRALGRGDDGGRHGIARADFEFGYRGRRRADSQWRQRPLVSGGRRDCAARGHAGYHRARKDGAHAGSLAANSGRVAAAFGPRGGSARRFAFRGNNRMSTQSMAATQAAGAQQDALAAPAPLCLNVTAHLDHRFGGLTTSLPEFCRALEATGKYRSQLAAFCDADETAPEHSSAAVLPAGRARWMFDRGLRQRLETLVREAGAIHIHGIWQEHCMAAAALARAHRKPYLIAAHGMLEPWAFRNKGWKKRAYWQLFEKRRFAQAGCLRALTTAEAEQYRALGLRTPVAVIPNGVTLPGRRTRSAFSSVFQSCADARSRSSSAACIPKREFTCCAGRGGRSAPNIPMRIW